MTTWSLETLYFSVRLTSKKKKKKSLDSSGKFKFRFTFCRTKISELLLSARLNWAEGCGELAFWRWLCSPAVQIMKQETGKYGGYDFFTGIYQIIEYSELEETHRNDEVHVAVCIRTTAPGQNRLNRPPKVFAKDVPKIYTISQPTSLMPFTSEALSLFQWPHGSTYNLTVALSVQYQCLSHAWGCDGQRHLLRG